MFLRSCGPLLKADLIDLTAQIQNSTWDSSISIHVPEGSIFVNGTRLGPKRIVCKSRYAGPVTVGSHCVHIPS